MYHSYIRRLLHRPCGCQADDIRGVVRQLLPTRSEGWELWLLLQRFDPTARDEFPAIDNIREPVFFGDAAKLFLGPCPKLDDEGNPCIEQVKVERNIDIGNSEQTFRLIYQCIAGHSRFTYDFAKLEIRKWVNTIRSLLDKHMKLRESCRSEGENVEVSPHLIQLWFAGFVLETMSSAIVGDTDPWLEYQKRWPNESGLLSLCLRLAALVSCGLGVSAYSWSAEHQTPVLVHVERECFGRRESLLHPSISDSLQMLFHRSSTLVHIVRLLRRTCLDADTSHRDCSRVYVILSERFSLIFNARSYCAIASSYLP